MKKLLKLSTLLLTLVLLFNFAACSAFGAVQKALKGAGYEVVDTEENALSKDAKNDERVTNVHIFTNKNSLSGIELAKLTIVVVIEFRATDELVDYFKESDTLKGLVKDIKEDGTADEIYNALKTAGLVHKNCIVAPLGLDAENVLKVISEL